MVRIPPKAKTRFAGTLTRRDTVCICGSVSSSADGKGIFRKWLGMVSFEKFFGDPSSGCTMRPEVFNSGRAWVRVHSDIVTDRVQRVCIK